MTSSALSADLESVSPSLTLVPTAAAPEVEPQSFVGVAPDGAQMLITLFHDGGAPEVAFRSHEHERWSAPVPLREVS